MGDGQLRFDGKVAAITGAGSGRGRAYARLLAARGARVIVHDLPGGDGNPAPAEVVRDEIIADGGSAIAYSGSVTDPQSGPSLVATAIRTWGQLDILVSNAGIVRDRSFAQMTASDFTAVLQTHIGGTAAMTHAAWRPMLDQGYGRIVLTTSAAGLFGNSGQANFAAATSTFIGMARTLAIEGAESDVLVNLISPDPDPDVIVGASPRGKDGRAKRATANLASADQAAPMVAYLCHESCQVSGEIFAARGGRFARDLIVETPGYDCAKATIEDIAAHLPQIMDAATWSVPETPAKV
jgi:NAD(P)-dependent dehydrogenase (short-subunit alcohol dehydrogenase family)